MWGGWGEVGCDPMVPGRVCAGHPAAFQSPLPESPLMVSCWPGGAMFQDVLKPILHAGLFHEESYLLLPPGACENSSILQALGRIAMKSPANPCLTRISHTINFSLLWELLSLRRSLEQGFRHKDRTEIGTNHIWRAEERRGHVPSKMEREF